MIEKITSLWSTTECLAWSKGFDYEEYLSLGVERKDGCSAVSEDGYKALCSVFDMEMGE